MVSVAGGHDWLTHDWEGTGPRSSLGRRSALPAGLVGSEPSTSAYFSRAEAGDPEGWSDEVPGRSGVADLGDSSGDFFLLGLASFGHSHEQFLVGVGQEARNSWTPTVTSRSPDIVARTSPGISSAWSAPETLTVRDLNA